MLDLISLKSQVRNASRIAYMFLTYWRDLLLYSVYIYIHTYIHTVIPRLTSDPVNEFFLKMQPHVADQHQISDETLTARIRSTCLTRTVPHKICAAARTNVPLLTESKSTRNPTTVVGDPSHNPHKHYCQIKMGNVKCRTLYKKSTQF